MRATVKDMEGRFRDRVRVFTRRAQWHAHRRADAFHSRRRAIDFRSAPHRPARVIEIPVGVAIDAAELQRRWKGPPRILAEQEARTAAG